MAKRTYKQTSLLQLGLMAALVVLLNIVGGYAFKRFDLTSEGRYTITEPTRDLLRDLDDIVYLEIYLAGEMPADYRRMQVAITDLLEEFNAYTSIDIEWDFKDVFEMAQNPEQAESYLEELTEKGIYTRQIAEQRLDELSQKILIPGAIAFYKNREVAVNFLPQQKELNEDPATVINSSISTLEYNLANAIQRLLIVEPKQVVFVQGHQELNPLEVQDFAQTLVENAYEVDFIDLPRSVGIDPTVDLAVIAKPRQTWSEADKFKIDQFVMNGGSVLWLVESLRADLDSLLTGQTSFVAINYDLNLEDQLFQYGARVNSDLVLDREANAIPLFSQGGANRNFYPWPFYPVVFPESNHPIAKHLDPIMVRFASSLDTIEVPDVEKTILLTSSPQSTAWKVPVMVRLETATNPPLPEQFNQSDIPLAVLLEGEFRSLYTNRIPEDFLRVYQDSLGMAFKARSSFSRQVVISDGDLIRNPVSRDGRYAELGTYRFNRSFLFSNKDFLLNCVDYLTDNYGIIEARTKDFKIRPLDRERLREDRWRWQAFNIVVPAVVLLLFAGVYHFIRKKKYEGKV